MNKDNYTNEVQKYWDHPQFEEFRNQLLAYNIEGAQTIFDALEDKMLPAVWLLFAQGVINKDVHLFAARIFDLSRGARIATYVKLMQNLR